MDNEMINAQKLSKELIKAGISTHGNCNSNGVVWDDDNNEIQDREDVILIINAHDPTPSDALILQEKYNKAGITSRKMIFALWKKVMGSDSTDADAIQLLIDQVILSID